MITELVKFSVKGTTTEEEVISKAGILNEFQKKEDGFIDAELVKSVEENVWYLIYHYENMEKVKAIGEKMRNYKIFDEFTPVTVPGSISVTIYQHLEKW